MSRTIDPQFTFADLEFLQQRIQLEPPLQAIAAFLDSHAGLLERVQADLARRLKHPTKGRHGLTAPQVLRSLILMRVKNWDYRELRERIADGYTLRQFTQFNSARVPKHDAFNRAVNRLTPDTLRAVNAAVIDAAVDLGLEDGTKLRVDTTVVETDIHYPTDSTLLWDGIRTITRLVRDQLAAAWPPLGAAFPDRRRRARRRMQEIVRMRNRRGTGERTFRRRYRNLLAVADEIVRQARVVVDSARVHPTAAPHQRMRLDARATEIAHYVTLTERVIDQTRRRVFAGETVAADAKLYSIFEPHTDLIKRGKVLKPVEFGHKVFLAESGHGLITQYQVLTGNPQDHRHVPPSLERHTEVFGHAPHLYSADRGFFSQANLDACHSAGVTCPCIPQPGAKQTAERTAREHSPAFKQGQRFRAGIEGRISVLFRGRGMKRARGEGRDHFELLVGAAVLANNLLVIAELLRRKPVRRGRAAA